MGGFTIVLYINDMATIDEKLRKLLAVYPEIQKKEIAYEVGVSASAVSKWFKKKGKGGSKPDAPTLKKLADYFNVSMDYFFDEDAIMITKPEEDFSKLSPEFLELKEIIDNASDEDRQALLHLARAIKKARNQ